MSTKAKNTQMIVALVLVSKDKKMFVTHKNPIYQKKGCRVDFMSAIPTAKVNYKLGDTAIGKAKEIVISQLGLDNANVKYTHLFAIESDTATFMFIQGYIDADSWMISFPHIQNSKWNNPTHEFPEGILPTYFTAEAGKYLAETYYLNEQNQNDEAGRCR